MRRLLRVLIVIGILVAMIMAWTRRARSSGGVAPPDIALPDIALPDIALPDSRCPRSSRVSPSRRGPSRSTGRARTAIP